MWTKKMLRRFPRKWIAWQQKTGNKGLENPLAVRWMAKRRKALAAMGYRFVSTMWLHHSQDEWVIRAYELTKRMVWVVRKK